jgi:hypothetical protein
MQCEEGYMPLYEYEITGTDLRYEVLHSIRLLLRPPGAGIEGETFYGGVRA